MLLAVRDYTEITSWRQLSSTLLQNWPKTLELSTNNDFNKIHEYNWCLKDYHTVKQKLKKEEVKHFLSGSLFPFEDFYLIILSRMKAKWRIKRNQWKLKIGVAREIIIVTHKTNRFIGF